MCRKRQIQWRLGSESGQVGSQGGLGRFLNQSIWQVFGGSRALVSHWWKPGQMDIELYPAKRKRLSYKFASSRSTHTTFLAVCRHRIVTNCTLSQKSNQSGQPRGTHPYHSMNSRRTDRRSRSGRHLTSCLFTAVLHSCYDKGGRVKSLTLIPQFAH